MAKTLLIVGYVWPEPNSSAAGSRMMELIHIFLQQHWSVIFASAASLSEHRADLLSIGVTEQAIELNNSSFDDYVAQLQPDAVMFDRFFTEEQFGWRVEQACPNALRILNTEDLHSLRHIRQKMLKQSQRPLHNEIDRQSVQPVLAGSAELFEKMSEDDMSQREIAAIFRCDLTLIISEFEMDLLIKYFNVPERLLHYCPFLTTTALEKSDLPDFTAREHFIAIGNFRHEPNWDSVCYLKYAIWPLIRSQLPFAQLHVYGAYPPPKALQLHKPQQGFHVKGWADDAINVIKQARVCLAPLRFGAGLKGKLMDAMRTGTPSVTTPIGAEGMCDGLAWGGAVASSAQGIAEAAIELYLNEPLWNMAQRQGFAILSEHLGKQDQAKLLVERLAELRETFLQERQQNFIGNMLRHHSHKSTQYMSQWIEAKNRRS